MVAGRRRAEASRPKFPCSSGQDHSAQALGARIAVYDLGGRMGQGPLSAAARTHPADASECPWGWRGFPHPHAGVSEAAKPPLQLELMARTIRPLSLRRTA